MSMLNLLLILFQNSFSRIKNFFIENSQFFFEVFYAIFIILILSYGIICFNIILKNIYLLQFVPKYIRIACIFFFQDGGIIKSTLG